MTLPQSVFCIVSKNYQYDYGIKEGIFYLIVGIFLWIGTFVISRVEKGIFEESSFCGFIFGAIIISDTVYNFIKLYQYVQIANL